MRMAELIALVPVLLVSGVLGFQLFGHWRLSAYHRHKGARSPLGWADAVRYHWHEAVATLRMLWWTLHLGRDGLRHPSAPAGRPVLCVHGFTQNGTNFVGIRRALEERGRPTRALFLGIAGQSLTSYARRLERVLRDTVAASADGVDVVAHSMGGVVLRLVLAEHPDLAAAVRRVVTLGSPHRGTAATRGLALTRDMVELSRQSPVLAALPAFADVAPHAHVTCVGSPHDFIVFPESSTHLPGTHRVSLPGFGHVGLLARAPAIRVVVDAVLGAEAEPVGAAAK